MASIESIRRIPLQARTIGVSEARTAMDRLVTTVDGVTVANERMARATEATAIITDKASRRSLSYTAQVEKLRASLDLEYRSTQQLEKGIRTLDRAYAQGAVDAAAYDRTLGLLEARYGTLAAASQRAADAMRAAWKDLSGIGTKQLESVELSRKVASMGSAPAMGPAANSNRLRGDQVQNLAYQASDIVSSLGSGSSLATVAFQQGPQIAQAFGGPSGASVKGALAQAGEAASGLAARIGLVGAAIGGVGTVALTCPSLVIHQASNQAPELLMLRATPPSAKKVRDRAIRDVAA